MKRAMMLASLFLGAASATVLLSHFKRVALLLLVPLCLAELLYGFIKFNPFVPPSFVFPANPLISFLKETTGINRFWGYGTTGIEANFATQEQLYSPDGTDPLNLKWYNQFIQASRDGNMAVTFNRASRSDAQLAPGYGIQDLPTNIYRLRIMDMLGVKYIIDRTENPKDNNTFSSDRFKEVWRKDDWFVYENIKAAPRVFVTGDVRPYHDATDFEQQLFADIFIPGKTVLLQETDFHTLPPFIQIERPNTASVQSYTPNRIEIKTVTDMPQLLFLSDTYDHGWTAVVNGLASRVYKANYAFRAVLVPKGESTVVLTYSPKSFETGRALTIFSSMVVLIYIGAHMWTHKKKH
jgi:hypothetical protein